LLARFEVAIFDPSQDRVTPQTFREVLPGFWLCRVKKRNVNLRVGLV